MIKVMLYEILREKGLTQKELAAKSGFTEVYISHLINQKSKSIEYQKIEILCDVLNITPNDLFKITK